MLLSDTSLSVKHLLVWSLIVPLIGALQQQPSYHNAYPSKADDLSKEAAAAGQRWGASAADSLHTSLSDHRKFRDTHPHNNDKTRTQSSTTERALATLSPAENNAAVRAPPARKSSVPTGGIASRQQARSLQDWQVEDIVLLATVDGKIHARDRKNGAAKWQLETDRSMVETIYHRNNMSTEDELLEPADPLWIVEPSQDGAIYVYAPGSGVGMQKLGFTVKELAELAPYASEGHPAVVYTAEKRLTVYTINAATGNIIRSFSSAGTTVNEDRSCRRVSPLASLDEDECEPIGTLTLGRTEYTIAIQDRNTAEPISTIRYFEWGPNNRDLDLTSKYSRTMDDKYVYTKHDGWVFGLDMNSEGTTHRSAPAHKPIYHHKLQAPVARVYDVVRPYDDMSSDAALVILPQPTAPSLDQLSDLEDDPADSVFVNCTSDGSWYAFSEKNYPMVTVDAATTQFYVDLSYNQPPLAWPMSKKEREKFAGVHQLSPLPDQYDSRLIDPPAQPHNIEPPFDSRTGRPTIDAPTSQWISLPSVWKVVAILMLSVAAVGVYNQQPKPMTPAQALDDILQSGALPVATREPLHEEPPKLREPEPAEETIFPHDGEGAPEKVVDVAASGESNDKVEFEDAVENGSPDQGEQQKQKKKATRGKRGGRKAKEKELEKAEYLAKKNPPLTPTQPVEIISVAASESPQVSGPVQINSLVIYTDKMIGQGSCGTTVFEGLFEGRLRVAVKRMLTQYYELASQEVSFLQQSDHHTNVVRYYCQQKDDHFLYIAVELCQASLFDVWEGEKAREEERRMQLRTLKHSIQQDVPGALHQLVEGLESLHSLRIIHRDIKPQNILIAFPKKNAKDALRLVISDFGLGKNLPENVSTLVDPTGNAGTSGWKAPELISQPSDSDSRHSQSNSHTGGHTGGSEGPNGGAIGVKRAADIFSLGCLFFWVLTDGSHPYDDNDGWHHVREMRIKKDERNMKALTQWSDAYEPLSLINWMLEHEPENRPTASMVLNHPFFWKPERRLAFLCDCSDHFEREPRGVWDDGFQGDSDHLYLLERRAADVIGEPPDFLAKLDRHFVDTLGKQRKYNGNRLLDLLRALRNKKNHYEDMPAHVKERVGPLDGGYLNYWCIRFPKLIMACYEVVHDCHIEETDRFKKYFALGTSQ